MTLFYVKPGLPSVEEFLSLRDSAKMGERSI